MGISSTSITKGDPRATTLNPMKTGKMIKYNRAHTHDVSWLCRRFTKRAIRTLVDIMNNKEVGANSRLRAAELILNRGWGSYEKPMDLIAGLSSEQLKEAATKLKAMYGGGTKITIHSDKTVVAQEQPRLEAAAKDEDANDE